MIFKNPVEKWFSLGGIPSYALMEVRGTLYSYVLNALLYPKITSGHCFNILSAHYSENKYPPPSSG